MNFSKAFDRLDHGILARKLVKLSIHCLYTLFIPVMNFIPNRRYYSQIDGSRTDVSFTTKSSVPQCFHIGPTLFNIYVSEIPQALTDRLITICRSWIDTIILQDDINEITEWCRINRIDLNPLRTMHQSIRSRKCKIWDSTYYVKGNLIQTVAVHKDLGVFIDNGATYDFHVQHIINFMFNCVQTGNNWENRKWISSYLTPTSCLLLNTDV